MSCKLFLSSNILWPNNTNKDSGQTENISENECIVTVVHSVG